MHATLCIWWLVCLSEQKTLKCWVLGSAILGNTQLLILLPPALFASSAIFGGKIMISWINQLQHWLSSKHPKSKPAPAPCEADARVSGSLRGLAATVCQSSTIAGKGFQLLIPWNYLLIAGWTDLPAVRLTRVQDLAPSGGFKWESEDLDPCQHTSSLKQVSPLMWAFIRCSTWHCYEPQAINSCIGWVVEDLPRGWLLKMKYLPNLLPVLGTLSDALIITFSWVLYI